MELNNITFYGADQLTIIGQVDRAVATKTVDLGSIPGQFKPKTTKIDFHCFPS